MAPIKIAFYDAKGYDKRSFDEELSKRGEGDQWEFLWLEPRLSVQTATFAKGCDAVCCFVNDDLGADVLAELDALEIKLILMRCAGFDRVDLNACKELGISVARVPAYSPYAVAEFALALLMTLNRKTHRGYNRVRDANFTLSGLVGFDVHGKTVGVIGTGKIGQCFIDIMIGMGCNILCYDLYPNDAVKAKPRCKYVDLEELYREADIISIHAPLTKETTHLINHKAINLMKPGVVIINTSRGGLIDTKALVDGLITGRIGGAGLDVYEYEQKYFFRDVSEEELNDELLARLINMRNVVLSSHQAFLTKEALSAIASTTLLNLREFFIERKQLDRMTNAVQPPPAAAGLQRALTRRKSLELNSGSPTRVS